MHLGPAQQIVHLLAVDGDPLDLPRGDLPRHLPGQPADLALELPHARFAGVAGDYLGERLVGDVDLLGVTPFSVNWRGMRYFRAISRFSRSV